MNTGLRSLNQKADPQHSALVVIDVQNDFCAEGGMIHSEGGDVNLAQAMIPKLRELIDIARDAGVLVVFVRSIYSTPGKSHNYLLSESWLEQASRTRQGSYTQRDVCAPGSWNADYYGDVRPLDTEPVVTKHRFSSFHNTELDTVLRSNGIKTVIATGVATNICVETAVRDACIRDYYVLLVEDGTAAYSEREHEQALSTIDRYFGEVVSADALIKLWAG